MKRFDICPQPVWVFDAPPEVMEEAIQLTKTKHEWKVSGRGRIGADIPNREITKSQQYQRREDCKLMTAWFNECNNRVKLQYNMPYERLTITELWLTRTYDGGSLYQHSHGLSIVSAIFYITDSPGTHFARENLFANSSNEIVTKQLGFEGNADVPNSQVMIETQFPAGSAGKLVIFPSRLKHEVKPCPLPSGQVRYTMAYNTSMDGKCGFRGGPGFVDITVN